MLAWIFMLVLLGSVKEEVFQRKKLENIGQVGNHYCYVTGSQTPHSLITRGVSFWRQKQDTPLRKGMKS